MRHRVWHAHPRREAHGVARAAHVVEAHLAVGDGAFDPLLHGRDLPALPFGVRLAAPALPAPVEHLADRGVCQVLVVAAYLIRLQGLLAQGAAPKLARYGALRVRGVPLQGNYLLGAPELAGLPQDELARRMWPPHSPALAPALRLEAAGVLLARAAGRAWRPPAGHAAGRAVVLGGPNASTRRKVLELLREHPTPRGGGGQRRRRPQVLLDGGPGARGIVHPGAALRPPDGAGA
mmetsp:Transcript_69032/g.213475  ORF Transcript_69032/g.213475 Transcript_69032/m.213475 type:complete len:235 (+) Transcript_69032:89-793(+)